MPTQMPFEGLLLGAALTVVGLIISWVVWRRKGASAGLRAVAWSLLPLAFGLIGLMGLLASLAGQLVRFFGGLVFDPLAWAGVVVAGVAVVLWTIGRLLRGRSRTGRTRRAARVHSRPSGEPGGGEGLARPPVQCGGGRRVR